MNKTEFQKKFGDTARKYRSLRKLTQSDVADALGMSRPSIVNIEAGRQSISLYQAYRMSTLLGIGSKEGK